MSTYKSWLARALLVPIVLALTLTTGLSEASASNIPASSTVVAAATGTITVSPLAVKKYKMSTVKKHNKKTDCWAVVGKNVYKLTAFIKKHPGGSKRIIAICGTNATTAFRKQHGTVGKANTVLKKYKIGVLA
jgi:cytochrome b involved in lipid metabolism